MKEFIDDTETRINKTVQKLLSKQISEQERKSELSNLNDLLKLREIYIRIQDHNKELERAM